MANWESTGNGGGFVNNPLSDLIDGMLQGQHLKMMLHRQMQEDQAFKTNQALHEQQMSMQDIMNRQMLQEHARPVTGGMIENPAVEGEDSPVPGMGKLPGMGAYVRKADRSRTVKYGGQEYELKTPEEQEQSALDRQIKGSDALEMAKGEQAQRVRGRVLQMRGVPVPADIATVLRMPQGTMMLPEEIPALAQHAQAIVHGGYEKLGPGDTLYAPGAAADGSGQTDGAGMHQVATGGAPNPTGELAEFKSAFAPGYYAEKGITKPTPADELNAYRAFRDEKSAASMSEPEIAWRQAATDPDVVAGKVSREARAMQILVKGKLAARPVNNNTFIAPTGANAAGKAGIEQVPEAFRDEVQQVLDYRKALPANSRTNPRNQAINYWVSRVGAPDPEHGLPGYSAGEFANRNALMRSFEVGDDSKSIVALNTMINHIGTMWDGADKLDNRSFKRYNGFANWLKAQGGSDQAKPFQVARLGVSEELAKLLKGGVATKDEVDHWMSLLDSSDSPQSLKTTMGKILELAHARTTSLEEKYTEGMGRAPSHPFVRPRAQSVLDRMNGGAAGGTVHFIDNGTSYDIPADKVQAFKTAHPNAQGQ